MTVMDKATAEREYGNLEAVSDNYEKVVVTYRDSFPNTVNGIRTISCLLYPAPRPRDLSTARMPAAA